jgi:uncharacterized membrane protein YphA (DoxX/SURF4 family)
MTDTVSYLGGLCASLVGVVLLMSSTSKVRDPRRFVRDVANYEVLPRPLNLPVALLVIAAEPAIGLGLLLTIAPRVTLPVAIGLLGAFAAAVGVNLARKRRIACGCFGADEFIDSRTILRLATLIILVVISWGLRVALDRAQVDANLGVTIARASTAALVLTGLSWLSRVAELRALVMSGPLDRVEIIS